MPPTNSATTLCCRHPHPTLPSAPLQEHGITSDEALTLPGLPAKPILVLGGGYIATEFAGIFHGLGAHVHLMYRADKPLRGWVVGWAGLGWAGLGWAGLGWAA